MITLDELERAPRTALLSRTALTHLRKRPTVVLSTLVVLLVVGWGVAPSLFARRGPLEGDPAQRLSPPSWGHLFGTDELGRDVYARVVHGASLSLSAAAVAVVLAFVIGTVVGLIAGFFGGVVDTVIMRVVEVFLAIPSMVIPLVLISAIGFGSVNVGIAVGLASSAAVTRLMRGEALRVRNSTHVEGAIVCGARAPRVLLRYVLPSAIGPVLALVALDFGLVILVVSSLSFLGFGEPPPAPEWGSLVSSGRNYMATAWWLTVFPGLTIAVLVLATTRLARAFESDRGKR